MTKLTPVIREFPADLETPVSAYLKLKEKGALFLLESVEHGEDLGRYSFIGVGYSKRFTAWPGKIEICSDRGDRMETRTIPVDEDPLTLLETELSDVEVERHPLVPGLLGGAVGWVAYDYVRYLERLPHKAVDDLDLPVCQFYIADTLLVFDHLKRKIVLASLAEPTEESRNAAEGRLMAMAQRLRSQIPQETFIRAAPRPLEFTSNLSKDDFCERVRRSKESIKLGDIYQVVVSQRFEGDVHVQPFKVYRALRCLNPSPYMFYLDFEAIQLVGSSPEVHVKLEGRTATLRPIAGTRPRGASDEEDKAFREELLADEKERAEHVMLVDLARNDLGRCCDYGTVKPTALFEVEKYSHVQHLVSQVEGHLSGTNDAFDLLRHTFPAGTVTGAPKVRAMEIIEELEPTRRGAYAGVVGYFGPAGEMDTCITIRTILIKGKRAYLQAGAGILWDSDPVKEWEESMNKMEALKQAIRMAAEEF